MYKMKLLKKKKKKLQMNTNPESIVPFRHIISNETKPAEKPRMLNPK